jgi:hypothetical protein
VCIDNSPSFVVAFSYVGLHYTYAPSLRLCDAVDLTASPTPNNADQVARAMNQLVSPIPFRNALPPTAASPQLIVDASPDPATSTVPRELIMSAPRDPPMPPPMEPEAIQQTEIPAKAAPAPPPKRKSTPNKVPPPLHSCISAAPERLIESDYYGSSAQGAPCLIGSGASVPRSYDTSDFPYLDADPTYAPFFISYGINTPLAYKVILDPSTLSFDEAMIDADRIKMN